MKRLLSFVASMLLAVNVSAQKPQLKEVLTLRDSPERVVFAPGAPVAVATYKVSKNLDVIDLENGKARTIKLETDWGGQALAVSTHAKVAAVSARPNRVDLVDLANGAVTAIDVAFRGQGAVDVPTAMAIGHDRRIWCWSNGVNEIRGYALEGPLATRLSVHEGAWVWSLACNPDGKRLFGLAKSKDGQTYLYVWDTKAGKSLRTHTFGALPASVGMKDHSLRVSADGSSVAFVCFPPNTKGAHLAVCDAKGLDGNELSIRYMALPEQMYSGVCVAVSDDGSRAVAFTQGAAAAVGAGRDQVGGWVHEYYRLNVAGGSMVLLDMQRLKRAGMFGENPKKFELGGAITGVSGKEVPFPQAAGFGTHNGGLYIVNARTVHVLRAPL